MTEMQKLITVVDQSSDEDGWQKHGLCVGHELGPRPWQDVHVTSPAATRAKRICVSCPVLAPCLDYALRHSELVGIWGGTDELDRRGIRRRMRRAMGANR